VRSKVNELGYRVIDINAEKHKTAGVARICLLTPGHLSTNPRLIKEADALTAAGYQVCVVAADYLGWARAADADFNARSWRVADRLRFGPLAPLPLRLKHKVRQRLARTLLNLGLSAETLENAAWHPAGPDLIRAASRIEADLYIAHYPAALPAAAQAALRHGGRYAFDAEDFHFGDPPDGAAFEFTRGLVRAIEQRHLPGAAYVSAASPEIADAYVENYRLAKPTVILNVFSADEGPAAPTPRGVAEPGPSLYWFSQTIGPDRGLECAIAAIGLAKSKPHLYLLGQSAPGFQQHLFDLAALNGCRDRLHFLRPAPPSQMVAIAARHDIGLASETGHTKNRNYALTNKLFTYLLAGAPILISDTPAQRKFAACLGACSSLYRIDDATALAAGLDHFLLDEARLAAARSAAFELGRTRFNWEVESRILLELVGQALSRPADDHHVATCA
jgi:glycosyltransferase involved in cell wall biosynthesis